MRLVRARGVDGRDLKADVLEIVQPDAPFLVDSVMGEVGESGAEVKAMFHPIVGEDAAPVSMIQVWLAPVGEERRAGLIERVLAALADVRAAVADFPAMLALMGRSIDELARAAPGEPEALAEDLDFLRWMDDGHFVFLGARSYEYPRTADGGYAAEEPLYDPGGGLGVLRDPALTVLRRASEPAVLSPSLRRSLETPSRWWWPSPTSARGSTGGSTWTTSACAATAPTASPAARCASWACSPPRPMTSRPATRRCCGESSTR